VRCLLHSLRDDVCSLRDEVHATRDDLSQRIVDSELRTATAITDVHGTLHDLVDVLRAQHDLRPRMERCEHDITTIKARLHGLNAADEARGRLAKRAHDVRTARARLSVRTLASTERTACARGR
jgi:hypothetical protein